MSDFLLRLLGSLPSGPTQLKPRLPSRFEPAAGARWSASETSLPTLGFALAAARMHRPRPSPASAAGADSRTRAGQGPSDPSSPSARIEHADSRQSPGAALRASTRPAEQEREGSHEPNRPADPARAGAAQGPARASHGTQHALPFAPPVSEDAPAPATARLPAAGAATSGDVRAAKAPGAPTPTGDQAAPADSVITSAARRAPEPAAATEARPRTTAPSVQMGPPPVHANAAGTSALLRAPSPRTDRAAVGADVMHGSLTTPFPHEAHARTVSAAPERAATSQLRPAQRPVRQPLAASDAAEPPIVRVTIGRIEVRVTQAATTASRPAPRPAVSLDNYLRREDSGTR